MPGTPFKRMPLVYAFLVERQLMGPRSPNRYRRSYPGNKGIVRTTFREGRSRRGSCPLVPLGPSAIGNSYRFPIAMGKSKVFHRIPLILECSSIAKTIELYRIPKEEYAIFQRNKALFLSGIAKQYPGNGLYSIGIPSKNKGIL